MKAAFFETEDWEREYIKKNLKGVTLEFFSGLLTSGSAEKAKNADIVSVFINSKVDKNVLDKFRKVKLIATRSTGFDHISMDECRKRKIVVAYVPTYGENTVAEHAFALLLAISRRLYKSVSTTKAGKFDFKGLQGFDLKGKTLGVVGTGNIGKHVIRMALGFEMNILAFDIKKDMKLARKLGFKYASLNDLFRKSDIITLHIPYNKYTHHMINMSNIKMLKKGVIIINTARGGLIQTDALLSGLKSGIISAAGLDVLEDEKMIKEEMEILGKNMVARDIRILLENHILNEQENILITPHNAFNSKEAVERILNTTIYNIKSFLKGKKTNIVIIK